MVSRVNIIIFGKGPNRFLNEEKGSNGKSTMFCCAQSNKCDSGSGGYYTFFDKDELKSVINSWSNQGAGCAATVEASIRRGGGEETTKRQSNNSV